jgi:Protein of unknown function (DUF2721)
MPIAADFTVLTAVVAPAVLTNATSLLSQQIGNRIARVIDRTRNLSAIRASYEQENELQAVLAEEFHLLQRRAKLLTFALRFGYFALGGFAAEALIAVVGAVLSSADVRFVDSVAAVVALAVGIVSVVSFVASCACMVRETMIALRNLEHEAEVVRLHASFIKNVARTEQFSWPG